MSSLIYVVVRVKDINVNLDNKVSIFNWKLPLNAVRCLLKPRQGNQRKVVLLMLIVALVDRILLAGEKLYMYIRSSHIHNKNEIYSLGIVLQ